MDAEMRRQLEDILDVAGDTQSNSDVSNALDHACSTIKTILGMEEPDEEEHIDDEDEDKTPHPKCECGSTEFERCLECVDVHIAILTYDKDKNEFWVGPGEDIEIYQSDSHDIWLRCANCGERLPNKDGIYFD